MKIFISKKWGFTDLFRDEYVKLKKQNRLMNEGSHVKKIKRHGPLGTKVI